MKSGRVDLSEWVIHFVHGRNLDHAPEPFSWPSKIDRKEERTVEEELELEWMCRAEEEGSHPTHFTSEGAQYWHAAWQDKDYRWADDEAAFGVLLKIINDGFLRTGWSFRNGRATIYGPYSAVCFTEMPLYAMLDYARKRSKSGMVDTYAVAIRREDLYRAGARPVIYGLTREAIEARRCDEEFGYGYRALKTSCLPLHEQYRYVVTDLGTDTPIDWTHEREWRWTDRKEKFDPPGLPLWLADSENKFRPILLLVKTKSESSRICNDLKELYDAGYNRFAADIDREALLATRVLALDNVPYELLRSPSLRLDDLPLDRMTAIKSVKADAETLAAVKKAVKRAEEAGRKSAEEFGRTAPRNAQGLILDTCGMAWVLTCDAHSKVTAALLELKIANPNPVYGGYELYGFDFGIHEQSISLDEVAAKAAAEVLTKELGQPFYMRSRLD